MTATVVHTVGDLAHATAGTADRVVVMTMGALHRGHATLVRAAREQAGAEGTVIVTVFVNPTQFGAGEDFERYPRTLGNDVIVASEAGADVVFALGDDFPHDVGIGHVGAGHAHHVDLAGGDGVACRRHIGNAGGVELPRRTIVQKINAVQGSVAIPLPAPPPSVEATHLCDQCN